MSKLRSRDEAVAFARFLLWEHKRHMDDLEMIAKKLMILKERWDIKSDYVTYTLNGEKLTEEAMWIDEEDI